ncbi:MAG: hypothetical protein IIZ78_05605 [Clostridiales bacterium]|nr:hypothetical protein [Clostridiales bacterium]
MKNIINFIRYNRILKQVYANENFVENISRQMGVQFSVDRLNRVYAVINPHIQNIKNTDGSSSMIYQYNTDNTMTNDLHIQKWIMEQLNISAMFIRETNMFELMTYELKKLDDDQNYLIVFENLYTKGFLKELKIYSIILPILLVATVLLLCVLL